MSNKGFTLIELIVVMAIIAILVLLAAPKFLGYTKEANVTAMEQDTKVLADAAEIYHVENQYWPVIEDADPINVGVGSVDIVYPIDENKLNSYIKNIKGNIDDYGLVLSGNRTGEIVNIYGVEGKNGHKHHGTNLSSNQPVTFQGVDYEDIGDVPSSLDSMFTFNLIDEGTSYEIAGVVSEEIRTKTTSVVIPREHNGKPVTRIANRPDNDPLFTSLEELVVPKSIKEIGSWAFYANNLTKVAIQNGVESIGKRTFQDNFIESVVIPNSVKDIDDWAFRANGLRSLELHSGAIKFHVSPFANNSLPDSQAFVYARKNDGTIDKTRLVSYGGAKKENLYVPEGIRIIENYAFFDSSIKSVIMPKSVKQIHLLAFGHNPITRVEFKGSVDSIHGTAFTRRYNWSDGSYAPSFTAMQPTGPWTGIWVTTDGEVWEQQQ